MRLRLFKRRSRKPIATREKISAAVKALANGDGKPADQLVDRAGKYGRGVALNIMAASVDYAPEEG